MSYILPRVYYKDFFDVLFLDFVSFALCAGIVLMLYSEEELKIKKKAAMQHIENPELLVCQHCGWQNADVKYCVECGVSMRQQTTDENV
ncbi:MAG: hypothetical protein FWG36_10520 [Oscillospiraceae bacterium]|nr:hypothetical protein [Oscillospiraceae bacterium]